VSDGVPEPAPSPEDLAAEDLLRRMATAAATQESVPGRWSLRGKVIGAILVAGIGIGASVMSCVGQSFSLRQARAQEGIEEQLRLIRSSCVVAPRSP
jgi:hypothetical protein